MAGKKNLSDRENFSPRHLGKYANQTGAPQCACQRDTGIYLLGTTWLCLKCLAESRSNQPTFSTQQLIRMTKTRATKESPDE